MTPFDWGFLFLAATAADIVSFFPAVGTVFVLFVRYYTRKKLARQKKLLNIITAICGVAEFPPAVSWFPACLAQVTALALIKMAEKSSLTGEFVGKIEDVTDKMPDPQGAKGGGSGGVGGVQGAGGQAIQGAGGTSPAGKIGSGGKEAASGSQESGRARRIGDAREDEEAQPQRQPKIGDNLGVGDQYGVGTEAAKPKPFVPDEAKGVGTADSDLLAKVAENASQDSPYAAPDFGNPIASDVVEKKPKKTAVERQPSAPAKVQGRERKPTYEKPSSQSEAYPSSAPSRERAATQESRAAISQKEKAGQPEG